MKKTDIARFRTILEEKKEALLQSTAATPAPVIERDDLPDENDLASIETQHSFALALRDRDRAALYRIERTLRKFSEDGSEYGLCEACNEPINVKRLEAHPEAEMCIDCRTDAERRGRGYANAEAANASAFADA